MLSRRFSCACLLVAVAASAQAVLPPNDAKQVSRFFDAIAEADSLPCRVEPVHPFLDFAFRFEAGYYIACPLNVFEGKQSRVAIFLRLSPENGRSLILGETYSVPAVPASSRERLSKIKAELRTSGAFALGEGKYTAELLLADDRGRVFRKRWKITAELKRGEHSVSLNVPPQTVEAVTPASLEASRPQRDDGLRLTILLDAAPINPSATKLHAWDRTFLIQTVASLLRELPCSSVRLIAFNLDQQRELFREDDFDAAGIRRLAQALQQVELGT
ncbi:MAG: hypothetical protein JOZ62_09230, partial [Acidobacteriaceae bacterium]|nr:hypothetical protein [Acidobacteriaceae bacterium]